jgi:hypothetical protein
MLNNMNPNSRSDGLDITSQDFSDEDFAALAAESFRILDDEEARRADREQLLADLRASAEDEAAGRLYDAEEVMAETAKRFNLGNQP